MTDSPAVRFDAPIMIARPEAPWGIAQDLSQSGMRLKTDKTEPVGSRHDIFFIWGGQEFSCIVEVARHCDDGLAVKFIDPDDSMRVAIDEITQSSPTHVHQGTGVPRPDSGT